MITVPKRPTNTDAEIDALAATCERLQGFDDGLSLEQVDGMLCALAASPRQLTPQEWLPLLFDDSFERAFADPEDHARALQTLLARLRVLCAQLDPEALFDDPDALRLDPIVADWSDAAKAKLITEQQLDAEAALELDTVVTGGDWATGIFHAVEQLGALWDVPDGNEEAEAAFNAAFDQINVLTMLPGHERFAQFMATYYPANSTDKEPAALPTRDDLLADACMAVQDLRMYWVDFAPKTETIRVEAKPGRNDPCPCGSGKKYKKCHGATA